MFAPTHRELLECFEGELLVLLEVLQLILSKNGYKQATIVDAVNEVH